MCSFLTSGSCRWLFLCSWCFLIGFCFFTLLLNLSSSSSFIISHWFNILLLLLLKVYLLLLLLHVTIIYNLVLLHLYTLIIPLLLVLTIHTSRTSSHHFSLTLITPIHFSNLLLIFLMISPIFIQIFFIQYSLFIKKSFGKSMIFFFNPIIFSFSKTHIQTNWTFSNSG